MNSSENKTIGLLQKLKSSIKYMLDIQQYPYLNYHDKYKCIFIHIPKNAGTSILKLLQKGEKTRHGRRHESYLVYLRSDPVKFKEYEVFTIVRNPWDRLLSAYLYLMKGGNKKDDKYISELLQHEAPSFEIFVKEWLDFNKIYNIPLLMPQFSFVYDYRNQKMMVDTILRMENLETEFNAFKNKISIQDTLPKTNQTVHKKYVNYYDEVMKKKVAAFYQIDIELFQYSFDE